MTPRQRTVLTDLKAQYGEPDAVFHAPNPWPLRKDATHRIVRVVWWEQKRELFILPDGERWNWTALEVKGTPV